MTSGRRPEHVASLQSEVIAGITWRVFGSLDDVATIWQTLEANSANRCFQSYAWARAWAGAFGAGASINPRIVVGFRDVSPAILVPLVLHGRRGARTLGWLASEWNDYNGPLVSRDLALHLTPEEVTVLWKEIGTVAGPASLLALVKQSSMLSAGTPNPLVHPRAFPEDNAGYALQLKAEMKTPKGLRGGRTFSNLDRKMRALQKQGAVTFERVPTGPAAQAVVAAMLDWKRASLHSRGSSNPFTSAESRSFLCAYSGEEEGNARVYALSLGGKVIAAALCLEEDDRLILYQMAYDGQHARVSPGGQLLRSIIMEAAASGYHSFDFGFGDDAYKEEVCDQHITLTRAIAPLSALGHLLVPVHRARLALSRWAKSDANVYRTLLAANRQVRWAKERLRQGWNKQSKTVAQELIASSRS